MKSFQVIVLVVFAVLALIGLVVFATSKGVGGNKDIGAVLVWGTLPQDAVDATLTEMALTDKRMTQVTYQEVNPATYSSELAQAIAEGQGPDLVIITQEQLLSEEAKLSVVPSSVISERAYINSYVPMSELFLTQGGTYGVPLVLDPLVLYYNRALITSAGIASAPPTWEAVNGLAQNLTQSTPAGAVLKAVIPFGDYANVRNARAILSLLFFQAGVPITTMTEAGLSAVLTGTGDEGIASSEAALDFYAQFSDPAKTVYTWNRTLPDSRSAFTTGDLVLYPGFASERPFIASANPNLDFDMAPIPQPATSEGKSTYGVLYAAAIPRASLNPSGALTAALALAGRAPALMLAQATGMAPAQNDLLTATGDDPYAEISYPEALRARGWLSPAPSVTDGIFAGMIGNIASGRRSIVEALETANDSLEAALR